MDSTMVPPDLAKKCGKNVPWDCWYYVIYLPKKVPWDFTGFHWSPMGIKGGE